MNKLFLSVPQAIFIVVCLCMFSCDEKEEFGFTKTEGRPSIIKSNDFMLHLSYTENRLVKMKEGNGSITQFNYQQGEIESISYLPPEGVADGHGWVEFQRERDNKIQVNRGGEPFASLSTVEEIELNADGYPIKIIETGVFERRSEGLIKIEDGKKYITLTYDPVNKNLLKQETFNIENSELLETRTYKYDDAPGTMSHAGLPVWFLGYWNYRYSSLSLHYRQFLNHTNNLLEETIEDKSDNSIHSIQYNYTYGKNDYPIAVSWSDEGEGIVIRY